MAKKIKPQVVPLTALDATFLHLETAQTPMHVGGLHTFEMNAKAKRGYYKAVHEHIQKRLHLAPLFTRKLSFLPFDLVNPVWIDDHKVDLAKHIHKVKLPKPGTQNQLNEAVGKLHAQLLDRAFPLWQFYVIEGLDNGHVGLYTKVHHAAIDGQAGVALANAILDITEIPRQVKPREGPVAQRDALGTAELIGGVLMNQLQQTASFLKLLPSASKTLGGSALGMMSEKLLGAIKGKSAPSNFKFGPKTPLNVNISDTRAFATVSISLAQLKAVGKSHDASLNDVVLAVCSGALRAYLKHHKALPKQSLTAAVPVSLRTDAQGATGNQATMTLVELATDVADPAKRLTQVLKNAAQMKEGIGKLKTAMPTDFPAIGAPWWMSGLNQLYSRSRLAERLRPLANVVISNVPGPNVPLYLAGGKMVTYHPVSIVVHGIALNITLQSYNGSMDFGLIACAQAVPDLQRMAQCLTQSFQQLEVLAQVPAVHSGPRNKAKASTTATAKRVRRPAPATRRSTPSPATA
jgi:diacylglycerol O-acyltransferase / wax synthase